MCLRNRLFDPVLLILTAVEFMANSPKTQELTLKQVIRRYNDACRAGIGRGAPKRRAMKCKNVFDQICKKELTDAVKAWCEELMTAVFNLAGQAVLQNNPKLRLLAARLGVKDIILIDGTVVPLRPGCLRNFDCHGSGHPAADGGEIRPAAKMHIAFSLLRQAPMYITATGVCDGEREQVDASMFKDCLVIADRGYLGEELERKLADAGAYFLIKGRANTAGVIERAADWRGHDLTATLGGSKVSDVPTATRLDAQVNFNGHRVRILRRECRSRDNTDRATVLRTNLPPEVLSGKAAFTLYRQRWAIEIFNKGLKSGNALQSINSGKESVVVQFLLYSLIAALLKIFAALTAALKQHTPWWSVLRVLRCSAGVLLWLKRYIYATAARTRRKYLELTVTTIAADYKRQPPSKRDALLLKDFPLAVDSILMA